jgi:hypothetical protein
VTLTPYSAAGGGKEDTPDGRALGAGRVTGCDMEDLPSPTIAPDSALDRAALTPAQVPTGGSARAICIELVDTAALTPAASMVATISP